MHTEYPRARHDLEFIPFEHEGQTMILVRDRLDLVPWGTGVPSGILPVLALMDGRRSLEAIATEVTAMQDGRLVTAADVQGLLAELDEAGLLDSARYQEKKAAVAAAFAAQTVRDPIFAGQAYPEMPGALQPYLDELLAGANAPLGGVSALIVPHIDPDAGKAAYAAAYGALRGECPRRVVVLGVGHQIINGLYCLTDKAFATPLGTLANDTAAVARLRQAGGLAVDPDDLPHRCEHSIEFQTIFLRHAFGDAPFALVPILCGAPFGVLPHYSREAFREMAGPFLTELAALLREPGTLVVAAVDFCHIGPKFGHAKPAEALEEAAMAHDVALLDALSRGDADGFWAESVRIKDEFNVCGFMALATLIEALPPATLSILCHDLLREPAAHSAVTFAAAAFVPK